MLEQVGDTSPDSRHITDFVVAVRRRLRAAQAWRALGEGGALALGGLFVLVLAAATIGPAAAWRPLLLLALGGGAGVGAVLTLRAAARWRRDESVARHVGERVPGLGDDLWSAIELERELPQLDADPLLSPELVRAHRARVAERVLAIDARSLVAPRRARRLAPLVGVLALVALAGRLWPAGLARGLAALASTETPPATSVEPIVGDLKLTLQYPAYTQLPPREIPGSSGHVLALPGTKVTVTARSLVAGTRAAVLQLALENAPPEERAVDVRAEELTARFEVRVRGEYRFVLGAGAPRRREPEAHRIDLEPDRAPRVELYAPADPLEVAGPRRVELAYSVDDDYGLGAIELVWKAGDAPEARKLVVTPPAGAREASGKLEWDLGEIDLKPGVKVSYRLEAKDNDTEPAPNIGRSKTLTLSMFDPRAKQAHALADEEQLLDQAVQLLGDRLEVKRPSEKDDDDALVDTFSRIHSHAETLLMLLTKAEQSAGEAQGRKPASARDLKAQLSDIHGRLAKLDRDEEQLVVELRERRRRSNQPLRGGVARPLEKGNAAQVAELERDVIILDDLLGKQRLEQLLAVGDEMAATRDRLKQLTQQYKNTRSPALKQELERELRQLERKLAELQEKASQLASELPDQFLNAEAMGKNDMSAQLQKLRELLAKGDVDKAMAELDKMSQSLDRMMSSMESDLRGYRRERFSAEEKAMADAENKLSDLAEEQRQVRDETEQVRKKSRAATQRIMKDRVEPLVKREREKVAKLKKQLGELDQMGLSPYDQDELARIKTRVDDTERALGEGDLDEARGMAKAAHEALRGMAMLAREIAEELDRALPSPQQLMSGEDQKKLGELGKRQESLRKRTQELSRELGRGKPGADGKPQPAPLPRELGSGLREAGQHMERAEDDLRGQSARDAVGEQAQALDRLSQLKEQLQRERRPRDQQSMGRADKEPVRIPGADEFRAPKEFRQDLLDAMKRGAPKEYKEQLKRYYEELAR
jgi:hypothetical protein